MAKVTTTPQALADALFLEFAAYDPRRIEAGSTQWIHWLRLARGPHNTSGVELKIYTDHTTLKVEMSTFGHASDNQPWRDVHLSAIRWELRTSLQRCFGR